MVSASQASGRALKETALSRARFEDKVVVVSGAASGNGRAMALRFASEGAAVLCGDVRREPVTGEPSGSLPTDELVREMGARGAFVQWDIADVDQTKEAFVQAREQFGRIDVVVANAGIALPGGSLEDEERDTWARHLEINLTGTWNTVRMGLRQLIEQGAGGRIITLSSVAGLVGFPGVASGYSASKAGIIMLTRQAAVDGAPYRITANSVCPGFVRTALNREGWEDADGKAKLDAMHPLGRMGEPEDVAAAVSFLASDEAAWITGVVLPVDGGLTAV